MKRILLPTLILLIGLSAPAAYADDVTDQIKEALTAYEKKDFDIAVTAMNTALQLINQKQAEVMAKILPEPLSGWKIRERKNSAVGAGVMGGGNQAKRVYTKAGARVTVSLIGNSPMLRMLSMAFSNPMFQGGGSKLVIMGGRKVMQNTNDNSLQAMINNKLLVSVKGNRKAESDDIKEYFKAIDFAALEKMVK